MNDKAVFGAKLISDVYADKITEGHINLKTLPNYFSNILTTNDKSKLHIPIRGTESWKDVLTDMDIDLIKTPNGNVHHGAYKQYTDLRFYFLNTINKHINQYSHLFKTPFEINIYGHSMGAWLAILLFEELHTIGLIETTLNLFLYASPNFCDLKYKKNITKLMTQNKKSFIYSYASEFDLVPKIPLGLKQVVSLTYLDFKNVNILDEVGNHTIENFIINME